MIFQLYHELAQKALRNEELDHSLCLRVLNDQELELLPLLEAAFQVRKAAFGREVRVHILNNTQNGHCQEDCHYCAQAKSSKAPIEEYGIKPDREIFQEARQAYAKGASCYCMVFAGRSASQTRIERLSRVIRGIKSEFPDKEICVSTGFISTAGAVHLKEAGLDRLNHNLNTSEDFYPEICTTHTFADRLDTVRAAKSAGLKICSGMIVGMGETHQDIIDVAMRLRELKAESIPINFLIPIEGNQVSLESGLTPEFCLRVLCLFRFLNPGSEIRVAAGREMHLRSMEVMALYPANSLFMSGYLNAKGSSDARALRMIRDAGFHVRCDMDIEELLRQAGGELSGLHCEDAKVVLKTLEDLRPACEHS